MDFKPMQPGIENTMNPRPVFDDPKYRGSGKLNNRVAIITGGDSGIGRAVSVLYAKEGADIAIVYYNEHDDANETKACIEKLGRKCLLISGDLREEAFSGRIIDETIKQFGHIDIVVNNAAVQYPKEHLKDISTAQLLDTFQVNFFAPYFLIRAALPHLKQGSIIINTTSITAYIGNKILIDYSATKGALVSLTRSLALSLVDDRIRVYGVAPGPIWTPLVIAGTPENMINDFGKDTPMKRPGQPVEVAPAYVYLASSDCAYATGQVIHINGGNYIGS